MINALTRLLHLPETPSLPSWHVWHVFAQCQFIIIGAVANGSTMAAIPPLLALVLQELGAALARSFRFLQQCLARDAPFLADQTGQRFDIC